MTDPPVPSVSPPTRPPEEGEYLELAWDDVSPTVAVAEALADHMERDLDDVGPLYEIVELDALDKLLVKQMWRSQSLKVTFRIDDYVVSVDSEGAMWVTRAE